MKKLALATLAAFLLLAGSAQANSIVAFGHDYHDELGIGYKQGSVTQPVSVQGVGEAQLAGGESLAAFVQSDGTLLLAGANTFGQAGTGHQWIPSVFPTSILTGVRQASVEGENPLALMADGTVQGWGSDGFGQLGTPSRGSTEELAIRYAVAAPKPIAFPPEVVQVLSIGGTNYALLANGTVAGLGEGEQGQLGVPVTAESSTPRIIAGLSNVTQIAGGGTAHYEGTLLALKSDGTVWALGTNNHGQLGNGVVSSTSAVPVQVKGLAGVSAIAGSRTNGAASEHGQLYTWGLDTLGGLGYATAEHCGNAHLVACSRVPHPVAALSAVSSFAVGNQSTYAIQNGTLYAWGADEYGQLGNGSKSKASRPQVILSGAVKLAAENFGALVEVTHPASPAKITATAGPSSITVTWTSPNPSEVFTIGLEVCTGGPGERLTKSKTIARVTTHSYTVTGIHGEYEVSVGGSLFTRATVRAKTT